MLHSYLTHIRGDNLKIFRNLAAPKPVYIPKIMKMDTVVSTHSGRFFGRQVLSKLKSGIRNQENFEQLSGEILNTLSEQLLLVDNMSDRKHTITDFYQEIEKAQLIRQYHMVYEKPEQSKQLQAALNHLKFQFKLRFQNYFA